MSNNSTNYPMWKDWKIVKEIGRGSFGVVYEIEKQLPGFSEKCALKVIRIPRDNSEISSLYAKGYNKAGTTAYYQTVRDRIMNEYKMMLALQGNTNIVDCKDVEYRQHADGIGWEIFIRMELLNPLNVVMEKGIQELEIIKLAEDMCRALALCRSKNIQHRDIKPSNIFMSATGDYKLGDFGVAKISDGAMVGTVAGTYDYMSPEVYNHQPYSHQADIYSLGMVLYYFMNNLRAPFVPQPPAMISISDEENARNLRFGGSQLPPPINGSVGLKNIVLNACAFNPKERYQKAEDMLEDLRILRDGGVPQRLSGGTQYIWEEKCRYCGGIIDPKTRVCLRCGQKDGDDDGGTVIGIVKCPRCGKDVGYRESRCPWCNWSFVDGDGDDPKPDPDPTKKKRRPVVIVAVTAVLIIALLLSLLCVRGCNDKTSSLFADSNVIRIYGDDRYETSVEIAEALKKVWGVDEFDTVVLATGEELVDGIGGTYLANVNQAPLLLVNEHSVDLIVDYVKENVSKNGTVYIIGSSAVVSEKLELELGYYHVIRLYGSNRYETNLAVLKEAGIEGDSLVVCNGRQVIDGISAAAAGVPILFVEETLSEEQQELLSGYAGEIVVVGGETVVSLAIEEQLKEYAKKVVRVRGLTRYETSVNIAEYYFHNPQAVVLAFGEDSPDGICGSVLACAMNVPLLVVKNTDEQACTGYLDEHDIVKGAVVGSREVIFDETVNSLFGIIGSRKTDNK